MAAIARKGEWNYVRTIWHLWPHSPFSKGTSSSLNPDQPTGFWMWFIKGLPSFSRTKKEMGMGLGCQRTIERSPTLALGEKPRNMALIGLYVDHAIHGPWTKHSAFLKKDFFMCKMWTIMGDEKQRCVACCGQNGIRPLCRYICWSYIHLIQLWCLDMGSLGGRRD